jgi:hypothetical protein
MMIAFSIPCPAKSGPALAVVLFLSRQGSKTLLQRKKTANCRNHLHQRKEQSCCIPYRTLRQTSELPVLRKVRTLLGYSEEIRQMNCSLALMPVPANGGAVYLEVERHASAPTQRSSD